MSLDRSLKTASSLSRHRNVLSRAERLKRLKDEERWDESKTVFGLPKVGNRNVKVGKKTKKKDEAEAGATPAAAGAAPAAAATAGGKAPAAGAKAGAASKSSAGGKDAKK